MQVKNTPSDTYSRYWGIEFSKNYLSIESDIFLIN